MGKSPFLLVLLFAALVIAPAAQSATTFNSAAADTILAGPYDNGKMWTFEYPPVEYFAETYDFAPDEAWFERARLSVLRIPGCSASFVSPNGLVVTNHHCVRGRLSSVQKEGESLLDTGLYTGSLDEERRIPGYYADQLIAIEDVTDEVYAALGSAQTDAERVQARSDAFDAVEARLKRSFGGDDIVVQNISLYNGGRYSAYVFKRYSDVRFVFAVELQLGFFGGEPDNFTYPRYALDFAFLRVYGDDGRPLDSPNHFTFNPAGVEEGDLVFVIGNPGSTRRMATVSQLEFFRDVEVSHTLMNLNNRLAAFRDFFADDPVTGEAMDIRNRIFSISNSQKAFGGRNDALQDGYVIDRRASFEAGFRQALDADPELNARFAGVFDKMARIQDQKREFAAEYGAFKSITSSGTASAIIRRALLAYPLVDGMVTGDAAGRLNSQLSRVDDFPAGLEKRLLTTRLKEFAHYFGANHEIVRAILSGRTIEQVVESLMKDSQLASSASTIRAQESNSLSASDPAIQLVSAFYSRYADFNSAFGGLSAQEDELMAQLGQARFAVYGTSIPPDATFSPRLTDGIVKSYAYNGTIAPAYTTFWGMYDRWASSNGHPDWQLPEKWTNPPADLDRSTPLNFCTTADTIGGNSGSPVVTKDLELVGLNFDRNVNGLSRDYIFLPERGRNVAVDLRAVRHALDVVYDADRIVLELTTGRLVSTEQEADAAQR